MRRAFGKPCHSGAVMQVEQSRAIPGGSERAGREKPHTRMSSLTQPNLSFRWPFGWLHSDRLPRWRRSESATGRLSNRI